MTKVMNILYEIGDTLYVNLTNRCPCSCTFCIRNESDTVNGYDVLWLEREPTAGEVVDRLCELDLSRYSELVFCGYGEPMEAFDVLKEVARWVKENTELPVRINTNGHANLILGRDVCPELRGRIDTLSISLNSDNAKDYTALCHPIQGEAAYQAMLDFADEAKHYVPHVVFTIVDKDKSPEEIQNCKDIAASLGVKLRIRSFIDS